MVTVYSLGVGDVVDEDVVVRGDILMSGRLMTAREPRERGCSGSEMVAMRSILTVRRYSIEK
jgi:hypothetical protein